jgi:hypothetical protein
MLAKGLPLALVVTLLACSGTASTSPIPSRSDCEVDGHGNFPHNAPALEALLPKTVAGRDLTIWSVAGWCWVQIGVGAEGLANFRPVASAQSLQVETMQYALAGRSSVEDDPPYFVHVMRYPEDQPTNEVAIYLFFLGAIGVLDPESFDFSALPSQIVGGKEVLIGAPELFAQDEHSRGGGYFYDAGDYLFAVVTDDEAWAGDALSQLP